MNYIECLKSFIPLDKMYIDILEEEYHSELRYLGRVVYNHNKMAHFNMAPYLNELFDFLDGNGFEIIYVPDAIVILPIYTPEWEEFIEHERAEQYKKIQEAIKKIESTVSAYVPISCEISLDTSVEDDSRDLLEYSQLSAPRPLYNRQFYKSIYIEKYIKKDIHPP